MSVLEEMHAAAIARRRRLGAPAIMGHNRYVRAIPPPDPEPEPDPEPVVEDHPAVVRDILHIPSTPSMHPTWDRYRTRSQEIVCEVAQKHGLTVAEIKSPRKATKIAAARQECYYRVCVETDLSLTQIGRIMGDRDHTSVLYGMRRHAYKIGDMERAGPLAANNGKKKASA